MQNEKPLFIFEGSGAPEVKLKPRPIDNIKEMLDKCKENGEQVSLNSAMRKFAKRANIQLTE